VVNLREKKAKSKTKDKAKAHTKSTPFKENAKNYFNEI